MRIAVVSNMYPDKAHPSYGVFVKNFCNILDEIGVDHKNYVMTKSDSLPGKILGYIKFYCATAIGLLTEQYDFIYIHYASFSSIPVLVARAFRKKTVYTNVHGSDVVPENARQERMQKYTVKILRISEKVIVPSEYFKRLVSQKYDIKRERIYVSPSGGVDDSVFFKEKEKDYKDPLQIGYVGRISYKKGWDTLLKACSILKFPYILTIVGNGPEYTEMKCLVSSLGSDEKIRRYDLQSQEKLREIYNKLDVLVFPSEREGESLGLVAIESMMCGTPVIASDFAAQAYYVKDGENGLKYECGNSKALAARLNDYYRLDAYTKRQMEKNAVRTAKAFSVAEIKKGMEAILEVNKNYGTKV